MFFLSFVVGCNCSPPIVFGILQSIYLLFEWEDDPMEEAFAALACYSRTDITEAVQALIRW